MAVEEGQYAGQSPTKAELAEALAAERARREGLEARLDAMSTLVNNLRAVVMGDREFDERDVIRAPDLITQAEDIGEALDEHAEELSMLDDLETRSMSKEAKLHKIRRYLVQTARDKGVNTIGVDYNRIHSLFDGEISSSYASNLMNEACGKFYMEAGKPKEGFYIKKHTNANKEIRVDLQKIEDRGLFSGKNSESIEGR